MASPEGHIVREKGSLETGQRIKVCFLEKKRASVVLPTLQRYDWID